MKTIPNQQLSMKMRPKCSKKSKKRLAMYCWYKHHSSPYCPNGYTITHIPKYEPVWHNTTCMPMAVTDWSNYIGKTTINFSASNATMERERIQEHNAEFIFLFASVLTPAMKYMADVVVALENCFRTYAIPIFYKYGLVSRHHAAIYKVARRHERHNHMLQGKHGLQRPKGRRNV